MSDFYPHNLRDWSRLEQTLDVRAARSPVSFLWRWLFFRSQPSPQPQSGEKRLLIVRTDRIGDYLLFRNFLPVFRASAAYRDWRITYCGNLVYRDLAETYDRTWVDQFIWVDRRCFFRSAFYRYRLFGRIAQIGFAAAFQPAFSRDVCADLLVLASRAPLRAGVDGDSAAEKPAHLAVTRAFYNHYIKVEPKPKFEFYRNREVVERFLGEPAPIAKPTLPAPPEMNCRSVPYAVLAGGAASRFKQWPFFGSIAEYLHSRYGLRVYLTGLGGKEHRRLLRSLTKMQRRMMVDLCGRTTLVELAALIAGAVVVVANDTGAMHMAAMLGRPTICVSGGTNAVRFNLYPSDFRLNLAVVFPPSVEAMTPEELASRFIEYSENHELAEISVERVCAAIDQLLTQSKK
ncbi:MAG: glycosyltransferase family 9 protein [candidate division KSB1 bacterium]|nr:glycosyltransferase family 9 protein [candidate division KSB1 bacterium]